MTRIDFYLLEQESQDMARFACRLVDKAFRLGHEVYVLTENSDAARTMDDLLWTYQAGSFIPHGLVTDEFPQGQRPPVLLGWEEPPEYAHDVLMPLTAEVAPFFARFDRLLEIVGTGDAEKERSRQRFRFYRDRGYPLEVHRL
ncbi:MAG: DNA polymerase III subunit chi [Acidiferrobacteraceae bacterium]